MLRIVLSPADGRIEEGGGVEILPQPPPEGDKE